MEEENAACSSNLSEKLGNNTLVQCVENALIDGTAYVVALIESSRGERDVPAIVVFEDVSSEKLDPRYFCISNVSLGPVFSKSKYWVVSTIYPLWYDIHIRLFCGRIELVDGKETLVRIETQTVRDGWKMVVALNSSLNKSIAHAFYRQEEGGEWLRPFALKGNPRFRRLSISSSNSSLADPMLTDTGSDSLGDSQSNSQSDSLGDSQSNSQNNSQSNPHEGERVARQSLIHKESVIRVFSGAAEREKENTTPWPSPPAARTAAPTSAVKKEMVKRIKQFLFSSDLDSVRPVDVHRYIQSQFSCYREHRSKYRGFVDETILICYGQMDAASTILPGLFLGSEYNAADLEWLKTAGVRSIVNVSTEIPCFFEEQFVYHRIFVDDLPEVGLSAYFDQTFDWIDSSLNEKKPVFVHCQLGVSRSASVVIAYLIKKNRWPYQQAFDFVKGRRKQVRPNPGFVKQLEEYYLRICTNSGICLKHDLLV